MTRRADKAQWPAPSRASLDLFPLRSKRLTPYRWSRPAPTPSNPSPGWSINYGTGLYCVAYGSAWSVKVGRKLFAQLQSEWLGAHAVKKGKYKRRAP